ncbi:hypothetical protein SAMN04488242_0409 [Tessaracoccus oleiagri]|uniref:Uncharacterized protein n=2 Tax=Tessaracoccus oleiagri TaxID=686624 RepID=A0A1G9HNM2_9ACTN|nr:hypothetical protein SAMN04488242_0409 [Tessaracoccus oleiagri]
MQCGDMDELNDTGIADLLLIYSVKSHLIAVRPELERLVVIDDARPRLSFPTSQGLIVVAKSDTSDTGIWTVSGPGIGVKAPRPSTAELASTALIAYESARARLPSAA